MSLILNSPLDWVVARSKDRRIRLFQFATVDFAPSVNARIKGRLLDAELQSKALTLKREVGLPFWDGVLSLAAGSDGSKSAFLIATYHQGVDKLTEWVDREMISHDWLLIQIERALSRSKLFAVCSRVVMEDGREMHLPLLDLNIPYSEDGTRIVLEALDIFGLEGALFCSGKSYHFFGSGLLDCTEIGRFLGRALLLSPVFDRVWIAHQLIENVCVLRISPRVEYGGFPRFLLWTGSEGDRGMWE